MLAESPSPPLCRTGSTSLPLCSQPLSPGPQPFWREQKVAAFSLPLSLRGIALERFRLLCLQQQRRHTLQLALWEILCLQRKNSDAKTKPFHLDFLFFNEFFLFFSFPLNSAAKPLSSLLCTFHSCCFLFFNNLRCSFGGRSNPSFLF